MSPKYATGSSFAPSLLATFMTPSYLTARPFDAAWLFATTRSTPLDQHSDRHAHRQEDEGERVVVGKIPRSHERIIPWCGLAVAATSTNVGDKCSRIWDIVIAMALFIPVRMENVSIDNTHSHLSYSREDIIVAASASEIHDALERGPKVSWLLMEFLVKFPHVHVNCVGNKSCTRRPTLMRCVGAEL